MAITGQGTRTLKMTAAADAVTGRFKVLGIRWVGATTAGHTVVIKDVDGNIVWASVADAANFLDESIIEQWRDGITVDTLGSGIIYINLE